MTVFTGTKNFKPAEVACKCGCGALPSQEFMNDVQALRDMVGFPLQVTSGKRCPTHNNAVSRTGFDGPHTKDAIDFAVSHGQALKLVRCALLAGFTGIGVQQKGDGRFIHLDKLPNEPGQPRPTIWSY